MTSPRSLVLPATSELARSSRPCAGMRRNPATPWGPSRDAWPLGHQEVREVNQYEETSDEDLSLRCL